VSLTLLLLLLLLLFLLLLVLLLLLRLLICGPRHRTEQRSGARGKGANVRGHGWPSPRRPEAREQRRARRYAPCDARVAFLWLLLFGEAKRSNSPTAEVGETLRNTRAKREKHWIPARPQAGLS
jgi:hypothetical protein